MVCIVSKALAKASFSSSRTSAIVVCLYISIESIIKERCSVSLGPGYNNILAE